jgi:hypothetical protein
MEGLRKTVRILAQNSQCPGQDLKQSCPEPDPTFTVLLHIDKMLFIDVPYKLEVQG